MKVIAIDAGTTHGALSRSVELAARAAEAAGAEVERVNLGSLRIKRCSGCGVCQLGGHCKIEDDLPGLAARIGDADGVIYGLPELLFKSDERTQTILTRLSGFFEENREASASGGDHPAKRAIVITASALPVSVATFFGYKTGPMRKLRDALGAGGFKTIGSLIMNGNLLRPTFKREQADRARSLGRVLVGRV